MENASGAMESAGKTAASLAGDMSRRARDVADRAAVAAERASDWVRQQKLAENATAYVTANPVKAVSAAILAGALIAFLFTRRKHWP